MAQEKALFRRPLKTTFTKMYDQMEVMINKSGNVRPFETPVHMDTWKEMLLKMNHLPLAALSVLTYTER